MTDDIRSRVQAGMAWLDEHYPAHVVNVDLGRLNLRDCFMCALAQATGFGFERSLEWWGLSEDRACELGFMATLLTNPRYEALWTNLTEEWRRQYSDRLAALGAALTLPSGEVTGRD